MASGKSGKKSPKDKKRAGSGGGRSRAAKKADSLRQQKQEEAAIIKTGVLEGSGRGYAFLRCDDGSEDIFLPPSKLSGALSGDRVTVRARKGARGIEGEVTDIVTRRDPAFLARVSGGLLIPDERGLSGEGGIPFRSAEGKKKAGEGDRVIARLLDFSLPFHAEIDEILGRSGDPATEIMAVIRAKKLREVFPKSVKKEAAAVPQTIVENETAARTDYRTQAAVTIDGEDSKDFDDAVYVEKRADGGYKLYVHIADVSHYVRPNTALDKEAFLRGTSVYFADRVLPMLPESLSNGICSLNEGEDRLTLSVEMQFDADGSVTAHRICEGVIRSHRRMTYASVQAVLDGDKAERAKIKALTPMLTAAGELASLLLKRSDERGAVDFDAAECEFDIDKEGRVTDIRIKERLFSHRLIEVFMIAANETVAKHFAALKVPFVYRTHEAPPPEKTEALTAFLKTIGIPFPESPVQKDYNALFKSVRDELRYCVTRVALRSMSKADYKTQCLGHYGLGLTFYSHFTSPIRRYPDLMIHRIIKQVLGGGAQSAKMYAAAAEEAARQSGVTERAAEDAERKVDDLLKAMYMRDKIGNVYAGLVSGVTEWGLFIELPNGVEGLLRIEALPGTGYAFDRDRMCLSRSGGAAYRLGERLSIKVEAVNDDKISFTLA